ncbi:MAG: hypothetical protein JWM64_1605 [Frankiales bacterium]|nr:hypothetical protein [Frankiales bacterium]
MTRTSDGLAVDADLLVAAERAVAQALGALGGAVPDLVCVFVSGASPDEAEAVGARVHELARPRVLLGCTARGVVGGDRGVEERPAVSVWAAVLPGAVLRPFHLEVLQGEAGSAVVGMPQPAEDDEVVVLLADPWSFPADGFVARSRDVLGALPVVGGLASGLAGAGSTRLLLDGRAVDRGAVGVVLSGTGAQVVVSQGCRSVGPAMTVTRAAGNVLHELAGVGALARVEQVLRDLPPEDQALASAGLHLGLAADEHPEEPEYLVRAVLGTEPETGGLVVGDLVEVGRTVRLQVRDPEAADVELRALLLRARGGGGPASGALLFTCTGRGAALFGPTLGGADHDPQVVREVLGAQGVGGFFAGGELGPVAGRNHLHAWTAALLLLP